MAEDEFPRIARITATQRGPIVNVAGWILMVTAILFTLFRLVSNFFLRGRYGQHDYWIIVANALAIGQTIATSVMVGHGLGQHQDTLRAAEITTYLKGLQASSILYIATLAAVKFSLLIFVSDVLAPGQTTLRRVVFTAQSLVGVYLLASIFTLGFACSLPATYDIFGGNCINLDAFWTVHTVAEILACLTIFILPIVIAAPLKMSNSLKTQIVLPFALEIPLCAFAIVRLVYLRDALAAQDHTWKSVQSQVWTQISIHLSIVAANIPSLKIFLKGFESMLFRQDTTRIQTAMHSRSGTQSDPVGSGLAAVPARSGWFGSRGAGSAEGSGRGARKSRSRKDRQESEFRPDDGETTAIVAATSKHEFGSDGLSDKHAQDSAGRDRIYKTTEWTVLGERRSGDD